MHTFAIAMTKNTHAALADDSPIRFSSFKASESRGEVNSFDYCIERFYPLSVDPCKEDE